MRTAGIKKDNRILLIAAYAVSALLLVYYLYVLFLGSHPQVTKEYRMFYIDHELKYRVPEGALKVRPGVTLYLDGKEDSDNTFYGLGQGFAFEYTGHAMENTGYCYTTAEHNYLYFDEVEKGAHTLRLRLKDQDPSRGEIYVNGIRAGGLDNVVNNEIVVDIIPEMIEEKGDDKADLVVDIIPNEGNVVRLESLTFD